MTNFIKDVRLTGEKFVREYYLENGDSIKATDNHPLTQRGYVYAGDLTTSDFIVRITECKLNNMDTNGQRNKMDTTSQQENFPRWKKKWLHQYVWFVENGIQEHGYSVHHKDRNKDNNSISNLELLSKAEHSTEHGKESRARNLSESGVKILEKARTEAKKWHKSKEGREWHIKHGC